MPPEPLRAELRRRLAADHVRISGYRDAQPQLKQFLEQLARYLGLIGLTALFIGGLGVAMSIHAFMQEKMKTIAILKTLGADSAVLIKVYVVQAIGLGLIGSGVGIVLGILLQRWLPPLLAGAFVSDLLDQLGVSAELSFVSIGPLLKGGAMGLLTTVLFALWPLLRVREIRPAAIFRREVEGGIPDEHNRGRRWWIRWGVNGEAPVAIGAAIVAGLGLLSIWQAGSWKVGALPLCTRTDQGVESGAETNISEPTLCRRQSVTARWTHNWRAGGHWNQRDGDHDGFLGGARFAPAGGRQSPGGCSHVLLY
jgi:putative ABC transport system permease protein